MSRKRLLVIGGGAAGFFCAATAARLNPELDITIIEKTGKLLSKVKVSGGGRCNVTHARFDIKEMSANYPRGQNFVKKSFHWFFTNDTIQWFKERGVELKTEEDGRMFPVTDNSQTIIDCLMKEVNAYGVKVKLNKEVKELLKDEDRWAARLADGELLESEFLCIASGGFPKTQQFDWIRKIGHSIEEPVPSLFTFNMPGDNNHRDQITKLMGVSVEHARVRVVGTKLQEEGPLLITHWGMSGPVILRLSAWGARELVAMNYNFDIRVNWLAEYHQQSLVEKIRELRNSLASQKLSNKNSFGLPQRLWIYLLEQSGIKEDLRWADLPLKEQNHLISNLYAQPFSVRGKTTFKEEFVTAGGVKLNEIDPNTMRSKLQMNLYFAGEVMDVDGITGGYNFQHAWTSGWIAGNNIAKLSAI
jgi:predicted Rossmann fold flavoprotein